MNNDRLVAPYYDAVQVVKTEFPELANKLSMGTPVKHLFQLMQQFAKYTKAQLAEGNEVEVEHCYRVASEVLQYGTNVAKIAIENVYVYGVSQFLEISFSVAPGDRALFLRFFRKEYQKQISTNLP